MPLEIRPLATKPIWDEALTALLLFTEALEQQASDYKTPPLARDRLRKRAKRLRQAEYMIREIVQ